MWFIYILNAPVLWQCTSWPILFPEIAWGCDPIKTDPKREIGFFLGRFRLLLNILAPKAGTPETRIRKVVPGSSLELLLSQSYWSWFSRVSQHQQLSVPKLFLSSQKGCQKSLKSLNLLNKKVFAFLWNQLLVAPLLPLQFAPSLKQGAII